MAGGKETPRQKMIGLMYLVLTAMLALNVSKAVLKGYVSVNDSLEKTKKNITENNRLISEAFKASLAGNPKAAPYYNEALIAQKELNEVYKYVDDVKGNFMGVVVGLPEGNGVKGDTINLKYTGMWYDKIDDYDIPTQVLLGNPDNPKTGSLSAAELKSKLEALHSKLIAQLDRMQKTDGLHLLEDDYKSLVKKINVLKPVASGYVEDGKEFTWEMEMIDHMPMGAVFVSMNNIQANIKNVEAEILNQFSAASGKLSIKPDRLLASVVAESKYISSGQPYKANIFLSAGFTKLNEGDMEVMLGVDSLSATKGAKGTPVKVIGGIGVYEAGTSAIGDQKYNGVIKFRKPDGSFEYYPFNAEYKVAKSAVAVSPDMMNVFYAGVPNPVSAGAAGVAPQDIVLSASGAGVSFKPGAEAGKYEFNFTGTGECLITVSKKGPDGVKPVGPPQKFRVKPLPKPEAKIGGKLSPTEMKKTELSVISAIGAGASGFDFKANYVVLEYDIVGKAGGGIKTASGKGSTLDAAAQQIFQKADVGGKIYVDLKVKGPDGKVNPATCAIKVVR